MGVSKLMDTLAPFVEGAGGKAEVLQEIIEALAAPGGVEECAEVVVGAVALYKNNTQRYHALLKAILAQLGPVAFRRSVAELQPEAAVKVGGGRFADAGSGQDSGQPLQFLEEGVPKVEEHELPVQVAGWRGPEGREWSEEEGEDMVGTANAVASRSACHSHAIAVYTLQVQSRVVWFTGEGVEWACLPKADRRALE
eukprot:Hpha_TRINITY_DN16589_c0_g2::TRINITY_DN16589_c0_g2_i1::g.133465::m.133465